MKKARIILSLITLAVVLNGIFAFNINRRGLSNLYISTTGIFTNNGVTRLLSYASLVPYRTFPTALTQPTVSVPMALYSNITWTITVFGGSAYTYWIVVGSSWSPLEVYADEDQ